MHLFMSAVILFRLHLNAALVENPWMYFAPVKENVWVARLRPLLRRVEETSLLRFGQDVCKAKDFITTLIKFNLIITLVSIVRRQPRNVRSRQPFESVRDINQRQYPQLELCT